MLGEIGVVVDEDVGDGLILVLFMMLMKWLGVVKVVWRVVVYCLMVIFLSVGFRRVRLEVGVVKILFWVRVEMSLLVSWLEWWVEVVWVVCLRLLRKLVWVLVSLVGWKLCLRVWCSF